ncbi:hypothetical protein OAD50_04570 [Vicingaceae bacterium]|nr:hypothetical protein [Vicingaceae bacterium]MDB9964326.1 hypothetical protein [Vicingaceae bacterium]
MKVILSTFLFLCLSLAGLSQEVVLGKKLFEFSHKADYFTTDQLGNIFLWNDNIIWKYSNKGDSLAAFNSRKYGSISHVDATNPYEIVVFFADYNLVLLLDNYLSDNGKDIDLQELGYDQISNACKSRSNGIWIYDLIQQRAIHLNYNYSKDKQTLNLSQWFNERITPNLLLEFNNQLFISSDEALFVFDHFGTFKRKIPIKNITLFQIVNEEIRYLKGQKYCSYIQKSFDESCREIPIKHLKNIRIEKTGLYVFTSGKLTVFSTNK